MFTNLIIGISISAIFFFTTIFIVKIYSKSFNLSKKNERGAFLGMITVPILFVGSMIIRRGSDIITPGIYTTINTIAGFAFYIFIGSILLAIIFIILHLTKRKKFLKIAAIFTLTLSILIALLGIYQAKNIKVTYVSVSIPTLPENWVGKKAVLLSDTHFGLVNQEGFSDKVIDKVLSENPDFVMHAGDFYDGPTISLLPITVSWKRLSNKVPVFFAPGNHEEYGQSYGAFIRSIRNAGVVVLEDQMIDFEGVQIVGLKYRDGKEPIDIRNVFQEINLDNSKPSILINHPPTGLEGASDAGIDLQVSGHTHNGQMWPVNYIVKNIYDDYTYGLNRYKDLQVFTTRGVGTFGPPFRTFNQAEIVVIEFSK